MNLQRKDLEKLLFSLLKTTKALYNASCGDDIVEIGRKLEDRQKVINRMRAGGAVYKSRTPEIQSLIDEILNFDKKACANIKKLSQELGLECFNFKHKAAGLIKYEKSKYNLMSGQMLDHRK